MAQEVQLEAGTLPPPACYATEQERFEAYVAAITVTITGGIQWEVGENPPGSLDAYWLQTDANIGPTGIGRPIGAYYYSSLDGAWLPWFRDMIFGEDTGVADVYSINPLPVLTAVTAYRVGMTYTFIANAASTGVITGATFNVNGLGAKGIKKNVNENLAAGDIKVDQAVTLTYDGVNFQIVSKTSQTSLHGVMYDPVAGLGKTWTVPIGVFEIEVECVGGGGGGDWNGTPLGGGGGGGYSYQRWTVSPNTVIPYEVGKGGNRTNSLAGGNDENGGDTKFNTTQTALGGVKASGGGAGGGGFATAGFVISGSAGNRRNGIGLKFIGGQAAWAGCIPGWSTDNLVENRDGILGGGGATDGDTSGNESSNGGAGCILIKW